MDLVFSDIHADFSALEQILSVATSEKFEKKYGKFSRIINLGDVLERGTNPKRVLKKLKSLQEDFPMFSVVGNHDEAILYGRKVSGSSLESLDAHQNLNEKNLDFFKENQDGTFGTQDLVDKKNNLLCVHGGPLNSEKIMPKDVGDEAWLYQKTWQRLSEEEFEFFSYSGYHYQASSAFEEVKKNLKNFIILCGHQHKEAAIKQQENKIIDIISAQKPELEKFSNFIVEKKEIKIEPDCNYIIRMGLGGPEGYYGVGMANPHFAIIDDNYNSVDFFRIEQS